MAQNAWRNKVLILLLLVVSCSKIVPDNVESTLPADTGPKSTVLSVSSGSALKYRIAPVDNSSWMDSSKLLQVHDEIDRMAAGQINMVIVGSYKFMPMYFVDYSDSPYPEAAMMSKSHIESQKSTLLANIEYAHKKGIKVLSGSYSHFCPYKFWTSHQADLNPDGIFSDSWLLSVHQEDIFQNALSGSEEGVVPHQQWNNPCFKDFWVWSTKAMLDELPTLDGFLNCYAESAWTYDLNKLKAGASEGSSRDMDATNRDFVDYMNTVYSILKEKKGDDSNFEIGIRDWYMDMNLLTQTEIPANKIIISVKYGGYDQPVAACPKWGLDLQAKGFNVIFDMLVYDAEFPHPIYWYDAAFVQKIFDELRKSGVAGFAYQDYRSKSKNDEANPIRILTQNTVAAAVTGKSFTRNDALNYLNGIYGNGDEPILRMLEAVTSALSDEVKLTPSWFWKGDGLTVGGLAFNRLWKFADNNADEGGRMEFIRQEVVGIPEYCEAVIKDVKTPGYLDASLRAWKQAGKRTPYEAIENMEAQADAAMEAMMEARARKTRGDKFGELFASAVVHKQLVLRDVACMKGTIDFVLSGGTIDGSSESVTSDRSKMTDTGIHKEAEAVAYFTEHVYRDLILRQLCAMFTPRRPSLDDPKGYSYISKPAKALGYTFTVPTLDNAELESLIKLIKDAE